MALDIYAFVLVSAVTLISAVLVFVERRLLHSVVALSMAFVGSALIFLLIGQTLAAMLQLIVFVGGFSTYLIVAVATEEKAAKLVRLRSFAAIALILLAGAGWLMLRYLPGSSVNVGSDFLSAAGASFQSAYASFYIIVVLLFGIAISGALVLRKYYRQVA